MLTVYIELLHVLSLGAPSGGGSPPEGKCPLPSTQASAELGNKNVWPWGSNSWNKNRYPDAAQFIWSANSPANQKVVIFYRVLEVDQETSATMYANIDDFGIIYLNGIRVSSSPSTDWRMSTVAPLNLPKGCSVLSVCAWNEGSWSTNNPAAMIAAIYGANNQIIAYSDLKWSFKIADSCPSTCSFPHHCDYSTNFMVMERPDRDIVIMQDTQLQSISTTDDDFIGGVH